MKYLAKEKDFIWYNFKNGEVTITKENTHFYGIFRIGVDAIVTCRYFMYDRIEEIPRLFNLYIKERVQ